MDKYIQISTTIARREDALRIAGALIEKRLAACVQILGPVLSIYRWNGAVEQAEEWQCLIKSRQDLFEEVARSIKAIHPYETPEIIATVISSGSAAYLQWLHDELKGQPALAD